MKFPMRTPTLPLMLCLLGGATTANAVDFDIDYKGSLAEGKHTRYIPAISNPLFNESPYITTEIRPILLHNKIPDDFVTQGGTIKLVAAEIRVALNDRWGIIASKDGYADLDFNAVLPDEKGTANVSLGVKYAVYDKPETNTIFTVGVEYEAAVGKLETGGVHLQGKGDGFVDVFATGATTYGRWGLQGNVGYNHALDSDNDSSMLHVSTHVNYQVTESFYPTFEVNVFSTRNNGDRHDFDFEGLDLVNFGSRDAGTVTTAAIGARYIFNSHVMFGAAFERPISNREDLMDRRFYLDAVITF